MDELRGQAKLQRKILIGHEYKDDFESALIIDNCLIQFNDYKLIVLTANHQVVIFELMFYEEDFSTISYKGKFLNGNEFRLVKPRNYQDTMLISQYGGIDSFTIGSISPDGYALTFILFNHTFENSHIDVVESGVNDQIDKLLIKCTEMMLDENLVKLFLYFSKRILQLVKISNEFNLNNPNFIKVIDHMVLLANLYNEKEYYEIIELRRKI